MATLTARSLRLPVGDQAGDGRSRGLSAAWPVMLIAGVLYGSLLPFHIDSAAFCLSNAFGLLDIGVCSATREDFITNIAVYIPIGLSLAVCRVGRGRPRFGGALLAILIGTGISILAEMLQTGIAARVASWTDVVLNAAGTAAGAALGVGLYKPAVRLARQLRAELTDRPFATCSWLLTVGLLIFGLAPFDFVTDTTSLHASFLRADFGLADHGPHPPGGWPLEGLVDDLSWAAWFVLAGYFHALSGRAAQRHVVVALGSAIKHGAVLVVLIELLQLFTRSHQFELSAVVLGILGVAFGAWCAVFLLTWPRQSLWRRRPGVALPTAMLACLAVFQVLMLLGASVDGRAGISFSVDLANIRWMPFVALWSRPMLAAGYEISSALLTYGALTITLAIVLRRRHLAHAWAITAACVTLLACGFESLQLLSVTHTPDLTAPVLAPAAAVMVARVYPALRPAWTANPRGGEVGQEPVDGSGLSV